MPLQTPPSPPTHEGLAQGPLIKIPVPKARLKSGDRKEPSLLQGWRDPYWKSYTSWYLHEARDIYLRQVVARSPMEEMVNGKRIQFTISQIDIGQLETGYYKIHVLAEQYDQARVNRNRDNAREIAVLIVEEVTYLMATESASALRAAKRAGDNVDMNETHMRGFHTLSQKRNEEHSIRNAIEFVQACNKAARKDTFKKITTWVNCIDRQKPIFWLYGEKGCGKTVLTNCFGQTCAKLDCLAASFLFFQREKTTRALLIEKFVAHFITDVAQYLGGGFRDILGRVATPIIGPNDEYLRQFFGLSLTEQLQAAFIPAWNELREESKKPLLVVIDGVEHLEGAAQPLLFQFINYAVENLPIAFFISSGPAPYIAMELAKGPLKEKVVAKQLPKYDPAYWYAEQYSEHRDKEYDGPEQTTPRALRFPDRL